MDNNIKQKNSSIVKNFLNENIMDNFVKNLRKFYSGNIYFLVSFPRSGNGWIRYLVTEALLISKGINLRGSKRGTCQYNKIIAHCVNTKSGEIYGVEEYFPDFYAINKEKIFDNSFKIDRFFMKTHHKVSRNDVYVVHLYRNPKDALISYYNVANPIKKENQIHSNSIDIFKNSIKIYLDVYFNMLRFYKDKVNNGSQNVHLIKMENITQKGPKCFDKLLKFLNINISIEDVNEILKRNPKVETIKKRTKLELEKLWDDELSEYVKNYLT